MNSQLRTLLDVHDGVLARTDALATAPRHVLDWAVQAGQLLSLYPGIYVDPARRAEPGVRLRAALHFAGAGAALSHVTALAIWDLPGGTLDDPVHVLVPVGRYQRERAGLVVHRRRDFTADNLQVLLRCGMPTCRVEASVVDSWAMLSRDTRRAAVIAAVADRLTTPERLLAAVSRNVNLTGRRELLRLVNLLARGCRSELELFGYDHVFSGPDLPTIERNVKVRVAGRHVYLDAYCPEARVNFELDGARYHTSRRDRERDARRDAALAAMGIMVVRFTHDQLVYSPDLVRAQVRAIVAARMTGLPSPVIRASA